MSNYYEIWQDEKFGDVLPTYDNPLRPVDDDEQANSDLIDDERKQREEEALWFNEQEI